MRINSLSSEYDRIFQKYKYIRLDEDESKEEDDESEGHGNTKLPYGLAKGEGIDTSGMTPYQVWNALEGYGYSPDAVYSGLKKGKHGKELKDVSKVNSTKKTEISSSDFHAAFNKPSQKKHTAAFVTAINKSKLNQDIVEILKNMSGKLKFGLDVSSSDQLQKFCLKTSSTMYGVVKAKITMAKTDGKTGAELESAVTSTLHEMVHLSDLIAGGKSNISGKIGYSEKKIINAAGEKIKTDGMSENVSNAIESYKDSVEKKRKKFKAEYEEKRKQINEKFGGIPKFGTSKYNSWVDESNAVINEYNKNRIKALEEHGIQLANMYDAITGGYLYDSGKSPAGHGKSYFAHTSDKLSEMLSIYAEMSYLNDDQLAIFEKDQPELAKYLNKKYKEILENVK